MMKTAEYYLGLKYPIELRELSPEEGGGWMASIPQLGSHTFVGDGDSPESALAALDELRRELIPLLLERGTALPEPTSPEPFEPPSGRVMLRIPRGLHAALAQAARDSDCSMNKLATQFLAQGVERQTLSVVRQGIGAPGDRVSSPPRRRDPANRIKGAR